MLNKDLIFKKIEQIRQLLGELTPLVDIDFETFSRDMKLVRSAERNFQLMVDIAIDINGHIITEHSGKAPDTYRQSFIELGALGVFSVATADGLAGTASLRNILVHEYDFEEDYQKFFEATKSSIALYEEYCQSVYQFVAGK
jgi:uncharacterized protein YutE (UPF0331/DUF86 family)